MCGICGKLNFTDQPVDEEILRKMCRSLSCRGPDDGDVYLCNTPEVREQNIHAGLGHQRLSIIDLSAAGHQPMCNEDKTIWIAYNGEIYNFKEIKKELESKGHRFKSHTDTEVIIHLYEEEGLDCMNRFNGMFSFALWDERLKRLFLCRDRIGIKPLIYYWDGANLIFGSEIKAVLLDPLVKKEIDFEALNLYLTFNYIPAPKTIFKNLFKLEPGHYLVAENRAITTKQYWNITPGPVPLKETIKKDSERIALYKRNLYELMEKSVKKRLIADVPLGAFLSGGVDSSIIVGLMARNSSLPVKTFSIGYKDLPFFDETRYSREVASFNKTEHYEFKLTHKDILEAFPEVLETIDEPFADSSVVPTYIVSRETRGHVTVALAGDGADELFAGYRMYQGEYFAGYYNALPSFLKKKLIEPLINSLPDARDKKYSEYLRRLKKFIAGMSGSFLERFYGWQEIFSTDIRKKLIRPSYVDSLSLQAGREFIENIASVFKSDNINRMLYADLKSSLPGDMLNKVDWMSMKNSLEVRVPFLDHKVVELVFKMEGDVKLRGLKRKYILLETFKDILPKMIHNRPKQGFEMPIGAWLRNELKFLIDDYLSKDFIEKQGIFEFDVIDDLIAKHLSKKRDTSWQLWNLIVFGHWFKKYYL